jgi:hypothetical protein
MSDFSDRPFMAGSLVGLRAFDVDSLGRLVGPQYGGIFKPGENVGQCLRGSLQGFSVMQWQLDSQMARLTGRPAPPRPEPRIRPMDPQHQVGSQGCGCGFYAYFDGTNTYARAKRVAGIIEGYGVCTVGTRGFRSEKARLVALVLPKQTRGCTIKGRRLSAFWSFMAALNSATLVSAALAGDWFRIAVAAAGLAAALALVAIGLSKTVDASIELVRRNYPDVPAYRSKRAALRKHPVTPVVEPVPTPDKPDFWTRAAKS